MFLFTVIYFLDYIFKSITVDGEKIRLIIADTAAALKQLRKQEGRYIRVDVSWSFNVISKTCKEHIIMYV